MSASNITGVFYADSYNPIQAGSIDGTDILPHDNAVYRALLCSSAGLYDPFGDPKVIGDPYRTLFVGHLSHLTSEETLRRAMSRHGRVKSLRLVRHIVTGASRGYAFVEYETEREMRRAYEDAHHSKIDDSEVIVDYNRQQLMSGWIPRRLGGGHGGQKESGQLRFGGRERPFRAPLRSIPYDDLKRLGIPPPPEGRFMSRFQIPSPPRRRSNHMNREYSPSRQREDSPARKRRTEDREEPPPRRRRSSTDREDSSHKDYTSREYSPSRHMEESLSRKRSSDDREEPPPRRRRRSTDRGDSSHKNYVQRSPSSQREDSPLIKRIYDDREEPPPGRRRSSTDREDSYQKHYREYSPSRQREDSPSRKRSFEDREEPHPRQRSSTDRENSSRKHHRHRS